MPHNPSAELIERYSGNLPRYTSYPTALEFSTNFSADNWKIALLDYFKIAANAPVSLYCHLPFCRSLCYFCACNKIIAKDRSGVLPYLEALKNEISLFKDIMPSSPPVAQLHWGGGSPNFLTPGEMQELYYTIRSVFPDISVDADISVELDPRTTDLNQLRTLRDLGFNRISLGVQDFDSDVQKAINRIQTFESTQELCAEARALGFSGINIDLIYGLPLQNRKSFEKTVELVATLAPDRVALYGYAHVTWIKKTQKLFDKLPLPEPRQRIELFTGALSHFLASGYNYIGMDHFALPGDSLSIARANKTLHRNFMGYSTHPTDALFGFGVSAISTLPGGFSQNERNITTYSAKIQAGGLPAERGISRTFEDRWRGSLIQQLMCQGEINFSEFYQKWGVDLSNILPHQELSPLVKDKLIELTTSSLLVSDRGRFFLRNIASAFDAYRDKLQGPSPSFSQAV